MFAPRATRPAARELARSLRRPLGPRQRARSLPGPLASPEVLAELAERDPIGAGTLEKWIECPYRWFVDHELKPQRLEPAARAATGGVDRPRGARAPLPRPAGRRPDPAPGRPGALAPRGRRAARGGGRAQRACGWTARCRRSRWRGCGRRSTACWSARAEARPSCARPLLEASFGDGEERDRPALELGELRLHGQIDRVDVTPGRTLRPGPRLQDRLEGVPPAAKLGRGGKAPAPALRARAARPVGDRAARRPLLPARRVRRPEAARASSTDELDAHRASST